MSRCQGCPAAGPCVGERPGWGFACKLAAGGSPADRAFVANRSATLAGEPIPLPPPRAEPPPVVVDWRRAVRLGGLRCFYASRDSECGCNGFKCHALGRLATLDDCRKCLDADRA